MRWRVAAPARRSLPPPRPLEFRSYDNSLLVTAGQLAASWLSDADAAAAKASKADLAELNSKQICAFLDDLMQAPPLPQTAITALASVGV